MKLVRQKNEIDCGLAVAAMVCETTWAKAAKADKNPDSKIGLHVREFLGVCAELGVCVRASVAGRRHPLASADRPQRYAAAIIRLPSKPRGHYIAVDGDIVLDPELGRFPLSSYPRRNWLVVRWFVKD